MVDTDGHCLEIEATVLTGGVGDGDPGGDIDGRNLRAADGRAGGVLNCTLYRACDDTLRASLVC